MNFWRKFVRRLARDDIAYLEYENRELRYEAQRWHDRYEGAISALRVFERRSWYMEQTILDTKLFDPTQPVIIEKERPHP